MLPCVHLLQEFHVTVTRKLEKPLAAVNDLAVFTAVPSDVPIVRAAIRTRQDAAAFGSGCDFPGQTFNGIAFLDKLMQRLMVAGLNAQRTGAGMFIAAK